MSKPSLRRGPTEYTAGNSWMLTFADLLSLLLTFFVLAFSMNSIQYESWKSVVQTMSDQFNPNRPSISPVEHQTPPSLLQSKPKGLSLAYLEALLARNVKGIPLFQSGSVYRENDKVIISVPANVLFDRKLAVPNDSAVQALKALAGVLVQLSNKVQVAGHTDSGPVTNRVFRSNWELSLTRARVVAGILADAGYRDTISVLGYADSKMDQLDSRLTAERRYELAERVDIIVIDERRDRELYDLF